MADQEKTTVKFGISQITNRTPLWAKYMFRITLVLTTVFAGWLGATSLFTTNPQVKLEIILGLKYFDLLVYSVSKLFGVEGEVSPELVQARQAARDSLKDTQDKQAGGQ